MSVLAIDIGSSSVRAMLLDEDASPIPDALIQQSYEFRTAPGGIAEVDAQQLQGIVERCIDALLQHPAAAQIRVVGMATFVGNLLGLDADGSPLTPVLTYADTRSAKDVGQLKTLLDAHQLHQRTGCRLHTAYAPAQLHWWRRSQPALYQQVAQWLDFSTYLYRQWFGRAIPCSYSVASWSGLLQRESLRWDELVLALLDTPPLPPLADVDALQQGLTNPYAQRWPRLRDVPFCLAVGDGAAANLGSGAVAPHQLALTVGTTCALRQVSTTMRESLPASLWSYRVTAEHHLLGGATSEGGNIFEWLQTLLQLSREAEAQLLERPADSHGLTFLPLLAGERSPGWEESARGTLHGLRLDTTAPDLLLAGLEGVALRVGLIASEFSSAEIFAGGGGISSSPLWQQIFANVFNRPVRVVAVQEVTLRGVGLLALQAIGLRPWAQSAPPPSLVVNPQPSQVRRLALASQRQQALYQRLYGEA